MTPRDIVKQEGFSLGIGDTRSLDCPFCEGGDHNDKRTLSVTRATRGHVLWRCFRAKCGSRGSVHGDGSGYDTGHVSKFKPNPYLKKVKELELKELGYINDLWGLDIEGVYAAKWYLGVDERADFPLLIPVYSPTGGLRGHVLRLQYESGKKEIKSYKVADEPWMDWSRPAKGDVVVVEDQISRQRASEFGVHSVAVLGTEITPDKFEEIIRVAGKKNIWLALDRDAVRKGFDYLKRYRLYCNNLYLLLLPKDIKNMNDDEVLKLGGPFK
jgi:hypothetical protein